MTFRDDIAEDAFELDFIDSDEDDIAPLASAGDTLSVREINEAISEAVTMSFPHDVWVRGEVQRLRFHSSGHIYFDLVDAGATGSSACTIPVTLLKWNAGKIKGDLHEVLAEDREVRLRARPDFYAPYGKMSLAVSDIDTAYSLGQIAMQRRLLIDALTKEGLVRANASNEISELPLSVAFVTSVDSAAYHDVIDTLRASGYGFRVRAINALMQGSGSPVSVVRALTHAENLGCDVVMLCRGGGAKSDLAAFDSELVARMIASMKTPVVAGLGHQIDVSVADVVSHTSVKTPTACANIVIEKVSSAIERLNDRGELIEEAVARFLDVSETRLANISQKMSDVTFVLDRCNDVLNSRSLAVSQSALRAFSNVTLKLKSLSSLIAAHDPKRVIERGFSLTTNATGTTIRSIADVNDGSEITTHIADGTLISTLKSKKKDT